MTWLFSEQLKAGFINKEVSLYLVPRLETEPRLPVFYAVFYATLHSFFLQVADE